MTTALFSNRSALPRRRSGQSVGIRSAASHRRQSRYCVSWTEYPARTSRSSDPSRPSPWNCATRLGSRSPGSAHTALPHVHTSWILGSSVVDPRRASDSGAGPSGVSDTASGGAQDVGNRALAPGLSGEPVPTGKGDAGGVHVPSRQRYACASVRALVPRQLMRPMSGADPGRGARWWRR
jgi:hypothetical protein